MINLILFGTFFIFLLLNTPIAVSLGMSSILAMIYAGDKMSVIPTNLFSGMAKFLLLAIPFFVLSGNVMAESGISKRLVHFIDNCIGHVRGGIAIVCVVVAMFFGAISGSAPATVAAVGSMTIPLMLEMGYEKKFSVALLAVAGGLGVIIPPSIPFILYAQAASVSVSDMFIAGIIPGFMIAAVLMGYSIYYCKKNGEDKEAIARVVDGLHEKSFGKVFSESIFALLSPVIILGCIYTGVTSPTEAAAIAVAYSLIISLFVYRTIKLKDLWPIFAEAVRTFGPILFILASSVAFSRILTLMNVTQDVSTFITTMFSTKVAVLIVINLILLIVGMIMDTTPAIMILTPILLPAAQAVGMDGVQFGIMMVVNLAIGFVTPPIGVNLFVASSLSDVPVMQLAGKAAPMILLFFLVLILLIFVPSLSLCLL